jgi:hypothetical protein
MAVAFDIGLKILISGLFYIMMVKPLRIFESPLPP